MKYSKCSKILYSNISYKIAYANNADKSDLKEQSDQGLYHLLFH